MKFEVYRDIISKELLEFNDLKVINLFTQEEEFLPLALGWYRGYVPEAHDYKLYNGKKFITLQKKTTGIYKKTCEDFASLLINEKCDIVLDNEDDNKSLDYLFRKNNFWTKANQGVEVSFALGYGFFVEGVKGLRVNQNNEIINGGDAEATIDFINAEKCMPLIVEDGKITDIAFVKINSLNTIISIHCKDRRKASPTFNNYFILNLEIDNKTIGRRKDQFSTIITNKYIINTQSDIPWFQKLSPNIVNNVILDSPLTLPICWNSLDTLESIDNAYDSLNVEINDSKRKTFVSEDLATRHITENGKVINPYDPNDARFYVIPKDSIEDGKPLIQEQASEIRSTSIIEALNMQLNTYTSKLGMGENYYNFNGRQIATATQVVSEQSALFRTIKKHEILIEQTLIDLVKAVMHISNTFTPIKFNAKEISVKFDDSIIEDKESQKISDRQDLTTGAMSNVDYRMKWFAEDEQTAFNKVGYLDVAKVLDSLQPSLANGVLTPKQFVDLVKNKFPLFDVNGLEEFIKEQIESNKMLPIDPFAFEVGTEEAPEEEPNEEI